MREILLFPRASCIVLGDLGTAKENVKGLYPESLVVIPRILPPSSNSSTPAPQNKPFTPEFEPCAFWVFLAKCMCASSWLFLLEFPTTFWELGNILFAFRAVKVDSEVK